MSYDLDSILRNTKQTYKRRLDSLTGRLQSICSEEAFGNSTENFSSRIKIQDLQDDSKSNAIDPAYHQLSDEVSRSRSLIRSLQKDNEWLDSNLSQLKEELWNEKRRHAETQKELTELRQSMNIIQTSMSSLQNEYHDILKRRSEDAKLNSSEFSKIKVEFDKAEKALWQKNIELELVKQELKSEKLNNDTLTQEIHYLKKKLREEEEKARKWKKACQEGELSTTELRERLRHLETDKDKLQKSYYELEREIEEKETSIQNLKEDLGRCMEFQANERENLLASIQKKYKEKKLGYLKSIEELNLNLDAYKKHVAETRSFVEKERHSHAIEIERYKQKVRQLEEEARNFLESSKGKIKRELQEEKMQFDEERKYIKEQYESILQRRIQDFDAKYQELRRDYESRVQESTQKQQEVVQSLDQRIETLNKHNSALADTIETLKREYAKSLKKKEEELSKLHDSNLSEIENTHNEDLAKLSSQCIKLETVVQSLTEEKNSLTVQLEEEINRSSVLEVRLQNLQESITYLEDIKKNFSDQVDDLTTELRTVQSEHGETKEFNQELQKEREELFERVKDLELNLDETTKEYDSKLSELTNEYHVKLDSLHFQLEASEEKKSELQNEFDILQDLCQQLERQKLQGKRDMVKLAEKHQEELRQVKENLMTSFDKEAQDHILSRNELMKLERELYKEREKVSELASFRETYKSQVEKYEKETQSLLRSLNESEKSCKILQDEKESIEREMRRAQIKHNKIMGIMKTAFVKAKSKFVSEMNALQNDVIELSGRYKRNLHEDISKALRIIADKQFKLTKTHNEELYNLDTKYKYLQRELDRSKSEYESLRTSSQQSLTEHQTQLDVAKRRLDSERNLIQSEVEDLRNSYNDSLHTIELLENEVKKLREEVITKEKLLHEKEIQFDRDINHFASNVEAEQKKRQQTEKKVYDEELKSLQIQVANLTSSSQRLLDNLHEEIVKLQLQHRDELNSKHEAIKISEEVIGWYRSELLKMQEKLDSNEKNAKETLKKLEADTEEVLNALIQERQRMSDFRHEKLAEIDEMSSSLRGLCSELDIKNETIAQLLKDKEDLRMKLREIHMESLRMSSPRRRSQEEPHNHY